MNTNTQNGGWFEISAIVALKLGHPHLQLGMLTSRNRQQTLGLASQNKGSVTCPTNMHVIWIIKAW